MHYCHQTKFGILMLTPTIYINIIDNYAFYENWYTKITKLNTELAEKEVKKKIQKRHLRISKTHTNTDTILLIISNFTQLTWKWFYNSIRYSWPKRQSRNQQEDITSSVILLHRTWLLVFFTDTHLINQKILDSKQGLYAAVNNCTLCHIFFFLF